MIQSIFRLIDSSSDTGSPNETRIEGNALLNSLSLNENKFNGGGMDCAPMMSFPGCNDYLIITPQKVIRARSLILNNIDN